MAVLLVQLHPRAADDQGCRYARRAGGDTVVAGEACRQGTVGDVAQLETALDGVADQRHPSARRLPFHGIGDVRGAHRLAERALVALAGGLVHVLEEAWWDGEIGHRRHCTMLCEPLRAPPGVAH